MHIAHRQQGAPVELTKDPPRIRHTRDTEHKIFFPASVSLRTAFVLDLKFTGQAMLWSSIPPLRLWTAI